MNKWISVKDRLPDIYHEVMFIFEIYRMNGQVIKKDIVCGHRDEKGWNVCYHYVSVPLTNDEKKLKITHWMELPELPNE
jgi:hypothetical protein